MADLPYRVLPDAPAAVASGAVLGRLVDGIGFRYHWATEGLEDGDLAFRPASDSMSLGELLVHIHALLRWVAGAAGVPTAPFTQRLAGMAIRENTLRLAEVLSARFKAMPDAELARCLIRPSRGEALPFWNMVNGPLADSLTHIGQVNGWRRMAGKPVPKADVFRGRPP